VWVRGGGGRERAGVSCTCTPPRPHLPFWQAIWLRAFVDRPWDASRNQPALINAAFSFPLDYRHTVIATDGATQTVLACESATPPRSRRHCNSSPPSFLHPIRQPT
jgi:hypothetical protein